MTGTVSNSVVLITGAAQRIGAAIARKFHARGFSVIVHCNRSRQSAEELADQFNHERAGSAVVLQADLTSDDQVNHLAEQTLQAFGRLDCLVNNASSYFATPLGQATAGQWHDLVDSNLRGAFFLSQHFAPALRESRGSIVNLLDIYAERPRLDYPVYSIAKAGLAAMTRSLAVELAPSVRVNGVAPGAILWPTPDKDTASEDSRKRILNSIPLGRVGKPEDIAETVFFLATEATYVTGEVIRVDGGRRLNL